MSRHTFAIGRNIIRIDPHIYNDHDRGFEYVLLDDPDRVSALEDIDRLAALKLKQLETD